MAALGMIEVFGFATSIVVADAVAKAADVEVVAIDRNKPANADKCEVPLVMVVKFEGTPAAVQAAHDAGMNAHLPKPLDFNKLKNMLARIKKYGSVSL